MRQFQLYIVMKKRGFAIQFGLFMLHSSAEYVTVIAQIA